MRAKTKSSGTRHQALGEVPTRQEVAGFLGLSIEQVKRLDYEKLIVRARGFRKPVRYTAASVRALADGSDARFPLLPVRRR